MQRTCSNCHRTFDISNEDIAKYKNVQNYANTILWQNQVNFGEIGEQAKYKLKEQSKAIAISSSVPNPYICPYCGKDTRYNASIGSSDNRYNASIESSEATLIGVVIYIIWFFAGVFLIWMGCFFISIDNSFSTSSYTNLSSLIGILLLLGGIALICIWIYTLIHEIIETVKSSNKSNINPSKKKLNRKTNRKISKKNIKA